MKNNNSNKVFTYINRTFFVMIMLIGILLIGGWGIFDKKLPESTGKDVNVLKSELESMNREFVIVEDYEFNEHVNKGLVSRIDPASGTKVKKGTTVTIYISRGKPITISDYKNTNIDTVKGMLSAQGLNFNCSTEYSEDIAKDCVISSSPAVGTVVEEGTMIDLVVSLGSEYRTIPDYTDKIGSDYISECEALGIKYTANEEFSSEVPAGNIITCNYEAGSKISIVKDTFIIAISKGPGVSVPKLVELSQEKAQSTLEKLGLTYSVSEQYSEEKKGVVINANKTEGALVDEGSNIVLTVSKGTQEQEFKDSCEKPSYDDLMRYPSKYESTKIKLTVKVTKIENETFLGIKYGETIWGTYQGSEIVITDDRDVKEPAFRKGDTVTVYGYGNGTSTVNIKQKTYQGSALIGFSYNKTVDSYDIPNIKVKYAF